jgi:tRNA nucleotidyltransferase (CCA-adding enzyme)
MEAIITHQHADLDALASLVAAQQLHPEAACLQTGRSSDYVRRYLALHKDQLDLQRLRDIDPSEVDHVIVVDVRRRSRLQEFDELLEAASRVTVYDHHPASEDDIEAHTIHVEPVGACATLLCEAIQREDIEIDREVATLMLLGIYADTGRLSFDSTTPRDVEASAHLLRAGARLPVVNRYLSEQFTLEQQELLAEMMFHVEPLEVEAADVVVARGHADEFVDNASDVVQHIMSLGGHEAVFGVIDFEGGKHVQIIGRSRVPYVHVGEILGELGGGGHEGAGGASLKDATIDETSERLQSIVDDKPIRPTRVRDLMTSPIETIDRELSLGEALERLDHWDVSGAPVLDGDRLEGIISRRDLEPASKEGRLDLPVSSHMSHEPITIDPEASLEHALDEMTEHDIGRLPVLEGGRLVGIVTRTDVLEHLYED